nr:MAG TPA: hypothetical protein [Bacteriophage sp.]
MLICEFNASTLFKFNLLHNPIFLVLHILLM